MKFFPGELPQVHYQDETFYQSHRVIYRAKDGGEGIPLLVKLYRQF